MSLLDELALVNTHSIRNPVCLFICPHFKATFISIRYDISLFKEKTVKCANNATLHANVVQGLYCELWIKLFRLDL